MRVFLQFIQKITKWSILCIIVQQNRFQASLQSQEVSWFGSTRTWVYLSYTNRSRVVLYLRPRSASVRKNHRPRGKATGGRKAPLFGVSCWWENYWWFAFLCVGIVVPCLSNGCTDFFWSAFLLLHLRKVTGNIHHLLDFADEDCANAISTGK